MTTPSVSNFDKISPTALLVAYARQFSDIPYAKEIAELTNAEATVNQFVSKGQQQPISVAALIEARYKTIEQVRTQFKATQILELASGLLPRGMLLSQNPEITYIESDLPEMVQRKQQLVQQLIGERFNLHFLVFNATDSLNCLSLNDYFQPDKPITILCEGLLMYLTFAEKQQVFANVRELLQTYGGVWITSDFTTKGGSSQLQQSVSGLRQLNQKIGSSTGRTLPENEFDDLDHAKQFAQKQGFRVEEFNMLDVIDQLRCLSALGIERDFAKVLLTVTPVVALTLA